MLPPDPKYLFRGNMGCVHCILFHITSNFEHLYAGTTAGNIHVWDLNTNRELYQIKSEHNTCLNLQYLRDEHLYVQHKSGLIKAFKKTKSEWILDKTININFHHYCRFGTFSDKELLIPLQDSTVGILSTDTYNVELKLSLPTEKLGDVMVIKPLEKEKLILVGYEGEQLHLWDIRQQKTLSSLNVEKCPMALDFDCTLTKGIVGGPSDNLQVFDLSTNHALQDKKKVAVKNPGISAIKIRPDSKIVTVGGWDGRVRLFSWKNLKPLAVLTQHKDTIHDIIHSEQELKTYNNKRLMATASKDGFVALWDIYN